MHFQLNRKWKSRSRKKADERAAIITLFLEDRGCPNGTHMSLFLFLFLQRGRHVGGGFSRRAANDANGLNCVLSSISRQTQLLFIHSPKWERWIFKYNYGLHSIIPHYNTNIWYFLFFSTKHYLILKFEII